jgi:glycerol-3-phosphate dehydrogenase
MFESASGLLSLGGGKLTTYRRVSERVVDRVVERIRALDPKRQFEACRTGSVPLPGADVQGDGGGFRGFAKRVRASLPGGVDDALARHFLHRYGVEAPRLLAEAAAHPETTRRLDASLPYRRGEVTRAAADEMASTIDDVLRRRVPISFRTSDGGVGAGEDVAAMMGAVLGWSPAETVEAYARYRDGVEREHAQRRRHDTESDVARRRRA